MRIGVFCPIYAFFPYTSYDHGTPPGPDRPMIGDCVWKSAQATGA
jgi:hypothetical protein